MFTMIFKGARIIVGDGMDNMSVVEKLEILSDAAKYDVSCSSSNSTRKNNGGLGNGYKAGICHSFSEDGRCISLLKILFTNKCIYDCEYCINRKSNDTKRAEFTPREVVDLTINFYKRNYIEGLFLSSGIIKSPDYTMEQLISVAEILRNEEKFNGYIHMKAIPGASSELIYKLGNLIDRMSVNIELPTTKALSLLAPQKKISDIIRPMSSVKMLSIENRENRKKFRLAPKFVPAGQTTQMIVGASREDDYTIITSAEKLYQNYELKRVYYSSFVPVVKSPMTKGINASLPIREHRIYQADFLMRFYKFKANEILSKENLNFDLNIDPKMNWAIENINLFPMEINKATYENLLRIPGFGPTWAKRIINARRFAALKYDDLKALKISTKRAKNFITVGGVYRGYNFTSKEALRAELSFIEANNNAMQLSFFK